jgi:hypothetical protein
MTAKTSVRNPKKTLSVLTVTTTLTASKFLESTLRMSAKALR